MTASTLVVALVLAAAVGFLATRVLASVRRLRAASRRAPGAAGCDAGCGCGDAAPAQRWDELRG